MAFSTHPKDDTGVAHILEHLSLSGSQRYPCRDPFMKMNNRSLATFMNAMTGKECSVSCIFEFGQLDLIISQSFLGCDVTFYPFSTQNQKDYENLLRVYLDAVFFPQLLKLDFKYVFPHVLSFFPKPNVTVTECCVAYTRALR